MLHRMLLPEISRRIGAQRANWGVGIRGMVRLNLGIFHYIQQDRPQIQSFAGLIWGCAFTLGQVTSNCKGERKCCEPECGDL